MLRESLHSLREEKMTERIHVARVGAPDAELRNSPIVAETNDGVEMAGMSMGESAACYFNGVGYDHQDYVCSGDELLQCEHGTWLRKGTCDPENP